ncbi:DUF2510 domain-containing protein [Plantibacter sp. LMC-P-059a]|uniref:DUF2510 domain-containing protein n=1 Tax=Plantibacter sp. LMC-P-059a TaxID=3040297 RepID=UPI00254DA820|nr:DUF2510 domain-containing protein [Plantibacter sp. LMC-P-059a]
MSSTTPPSATPAGWYPDYSNPTQQRYWDGAAWTSHTAPAAVTPPQQVVAAPLTGQPLQLQKPAPPTFATAPVPSPYATQPGTSTGMSGKTKGWIIAGAVVGSLLLVGGISNAINGGRTEPVAVAQTATQAPSATPTETPVPSSTVEPIAEPVVPAVVDVAAFQAGASKHTADIDKDLDDMAVTLAEGGTWRLLSNSVEISFNLGQLQSLDVPASIAAEWAPALVGLETNLDALTTAVAGGDPATIQGAMDGVRASAAVLRDIGARAV